MTEPVMNTLLAGMANAYTGTTQDNYVLKLLEVSGDDPRVLTPVECERLQGFPDNWTDDQHFKARYKQMGNAIAVPVVEWIVARLVAVDGRG